MRSVIALITFLGDAPYPDNTLPQPQPKPPWAGGPGGPGSGLPGGPVDPGYSPPWANVVPPVDPGYSPPWATPGPGRPNYPDNSLPLFPFHPIVVPPGGAWPGQPSRPPYPDAGLPPFATHLPVVPPGGAWPGQPPVTPPPTGPVYPMPPAVGVPVELVAVYVPSVGYVIIPKSALPEAPPETGEGQTPEVNPL